MLEIYQKWGYQSAAKYAKIHLEPENDHFRNTEYVIQATYFQVSHFSARGAYQKYTPKNRETTTFSSNVKPRFGMGNTLLPLGPESLNYSRQISESPNSKALGFQQFQLLKFPRIGVDISI